MRAAVGRGHALKRQRVLALEVGGRHAGGDHAPRQDLILAAAAVGVKMRVEAALFKGLHPAVQVKVILPRAERFALAPRRLDDAAQPAVAAGDDRFHEARRRGVPVVGDGLGVDRLAQELDAALVFLDGYLRLPLEGRVGLGHEPRGRHRDANAAALVDRALAPCVHDVRGDVRNAEHVLVRLGRKAEHKVELDRAVAARKRAAAGFEQVLFGQILVDGVAQALRAGLWREGKARLPALLQPLHQRHGEVVGAQRRQRERQVALGAEILQIVAQLDKMRIVGRRERGKRHILIARVLDRFDGIVAQELFRAVTHRAVDITRLTEAAAADAAAEQLERNAVLHDLSRGNDGLCGIVRLVHILNDALEHRFGCALLGGDGLHRAVVVVVDVVKARHIDAAHLRRLHEKLVLAPPLAPRLAVQLDELDVHLLALADDGEVQKVCDGLAVVHRCTARDDERGELRVLGRMQRDARKVKHIQDGGKCHLIADGKGNDVKLIERVEGFERVERDVRLAHLLLHIAPGCVAALAPYALHIVHHAVEDAHAEIRHTDLIGIGKAEGDACVDLALILHDGVEFPADIACRLLHAWQDAFESFIHKKSPLVKSK